MIELRQHPIFAQLMRYFLQEDMDRVQSTALQLEAQGYDFSDIADAIDAATGNTSTPQYRPDYGIFVSRVQPADVYTFAGVVINAMSRSSKGMWTTTVNHIVADTEFAVSFDFHEEMLSHLFQATCPTNFMSYFLAFSDMKVGSTFEISDPFCVDIEATVSAVVQLSQESFRPFVVRSVKQPRGA